MGDTLIIIVITVVTIIIFICRNFNLNQLKNERDNNNSIENNHDFNLNQLKDERGFKLNDNSIESADNQGFEIYISNIKLVQPTVFKTCHSKKKCELSCDDSCKRSLILETNIKAVSDWFSASFGLSRKTSKQEHRNNKQSTEHSYHAYIKAKLDIQNTCIGPTKSYIKDIEDAVKDTLTTNEKIQNLRKVSEKYGHFYAHHLFIGGAIIEDIESTEYLITDENSKSRSTGAQVGIGTSLLNNNLHAQVGADIARENVNKKKFSNSNRKQEVRIIGGNDDLYDDQDPSNLNPWRESLKKPNTWKVIGYDRIYPLFELLDEKLQEKVLKALGPRILKYGVDGINFNGDPNKYKPNVYYLFNHIREIKNIHKCQIFASIVSTKDDVFSLYVDHENKDASHPVIVVHRIQWKKSKTYCQAKAKLCWIIVGLPTSFDFKNQPPLSFRSGTHSAFENNHFGIEKITDYKFLDFNKTCILATCVLTATETDPTEADPTAPHATAYAIKYDPQDSKFVIGAHFTPCNKSACLFAYDINEKKGNPFVYNNEILQRMSLHFCAVDENNCSQRIGYGQINVEWEKKLWKNISYGKAIGKTETFPILTDVNRPILVNQLFDNCDNCQYHGFVNINNSDKVNFDKVIYGPLDRKSVV